MLITPQNKKRLHTIIIYLIERLKKSNLTSSAQMTDKRCEASAGAGAGAGAGARQPSECVLDDELPNRATPQRCGVTERVRRRARRPGECMRQCEATGRGLIGHRRSRKKGLGRLIAQRSLLCSLCAQGHIKLIGEGRTTAGIQGFGSCLGLVRMEFGLWRVRSLGLEYGLLADRPLPTCLARGPNWSARSCPFFNGSKNKCSDPPKYERAGLKPILSVLGRSQQKRNDDWLLVSTIVA